MTTTRILSHHRSVLGVCIPDKLGVHHTQTSDAVEKAKMEQKLEQPVKGDDDIKMIIERFFKHDEHDNSQE